MDGAEQGFDFGTAMSLMEVLSALIACDTLGYVEHQIADQRQLGHQALRSLNGYIRYVRGRQQGAQEYGNHAFKDETAAYLAGESPLD